MERREGRLPWVSNTLSGGAFDTSNQNKSEQNEGLRLLLDFCLTFACASAVSGLDRHYLIVR